MEITVKNCKIQYKESGTGDETVVILQGWGTHMGIYDSIAGVLSSKYRVIQFDFPGFGDSQEPETPWDVSDYADFFVDFMRAVDIKKATLMGHSYGGRVIIKLASGRDLPFQIDKIVLIDSAGVLPVKTKKQLRKIKRYKRLKRFYANPVVYKLFKKSIDAWKDRQGSEDYRNASPIMKQCLVKAVNEDLTELLPHITAETLLIWGSLDTATPLSDGRLMEEKIPNAGLAVINNAGHFCFLEQRALFVLTFALIKMMCWALSNLNIKIKIWL